MGARHLHGTNVYEAGRAHIIVYDWNGADSADVFVPIGACAR